MTGLTNTSTSFAASRMALNPFQQLMRDWGRLQAYNAGQLMTLAGSPDIARWQAAANRVLADAGLGQPSFDGKIASFVPATVVVEPTSESLESLAAKQLATPFAADAVPIRFFILQRVPQRYDILAIYDHWIADSHSIRRLMHLLLEAYLQPDAPHTAALLRPTADNHRRYFTRHLGSLPAFGDWLFALKDYWRHRCGYRVPLGDPTNFSCGFFIHRLPEGLITQLRTAARLRSVTVHDLFLAALGIGIGECTASQRALPRKRRFHSPRRAIALGTIVDIRPQANPPLDEILGMFLSCYTTVLHQPESQDRRQLIAHIAARSREVKQTAEAVRAFDAFSVARFWWRRYSRERHHADFFGKNLPTVAGISNVNLTGSWCDRTNPVPQGGPTVLDYIRISPTGPLAPLVLTLTTIGPHLSLAVTWRTQAFNRAQVSGIVDRFAAILVELAA